MPEGPEVKNVTDTLYRLLLNYHIYSCDVLKTDDSLNNDNIEQFKKWLPMKICNVTCKGKLIFIHLKARDDTIVYLHCHLRMTGSWITTQGKYSRFSLNICDRITTSKIHIYLRQFTLYFDDPRRFGVVEFITHDQYLDKINNIGPDLLSEPVTYEQYSASLQARTRKNMPLYRFLLEQKYFSGIGNYLKSEIMYRSRLHPKRTLSSLTDDDRRRLFHHVITTINEAYIANGLTIKDYKDPEGRLGTFVCEVYCQTNDPHGYSVVKEQMGGRGTYYVPQLQH